MKQIVFFPIDFVESESGKIVLDGGQNGRGWTAVSANETGNWLATISDQATAFIIFGASTAP